MRPRFFKRGKLGANCLGKNSLNYQIASMRPRFFKRGKWPSANWPAPCRMVMTCFNEAALFQARKAKPRQTSLSARPLRSSASMRPRFFKRGKLGDYVVRYCNSQALSFNEAALFQARKDWSSLIFSPELAIDGCFNEAALFQARKVSSRVHYRNDKGVRGCFNEAALFQARKESRGKRLPSPHG